MRPVKVMVRSIQASRVRIGEYRLELMCGHFEWVRRRRLPRMYRHPCTSCAAKLLYPAPDAGESMLGCGAK